MKKVLIILAFTSAFFWADAGTIKVVTTLTDLKSITEFIGGNKVSVTSIATGYQNPHFVDPKPSYIISLSNADLFVTVGLDLETGWSPQLLASSRNTKIQKGAAGYVDASEGVGLLQVPTSANRAEGDIHIYGNPHYWLDPMNGKVIARNIANGLSGSNQGHKRYHVVRYCRLSLKRYRLRPCYVRDDKSAQSSQRFDCFGKVAVRRSLKIENDGQITLLTDFFSDCL